MGQWTKSGCNRLAVPPLTSLQARRAPVVATAPARWRTDWTCWLHQPANDWGTHHGDGTVAGRWNDKGPHAREADPADGRLVADDAAGLIRCLTPRTATRPLQLREMLGSS